MTAEQARAVRKAKQLAALIESTTFEGERSNAIDAYMRICEIHRLDSETLEPLGVCQNGRSRTLDRFYLAQALSGGALDYETWLKVTQSGVRL